MVPISCEKYDRLPEFEEHQAVPGLFSPSLSLIARLAAPTALPVQERHVSRGQVNPLSVDVAHVVTLVAMEPVTENSPCIRDQAHRHCLV